MIKNLFVLILACASTGALSQPPDSVYSNRSGVNTIKISYGPSHLSRQDLIFSEFIHQDISPLNFRLCYLNKKKLIHNFCFNYSSFKQYLGDPYEYTKYGQQKTTETGVFNLVELSYSLSSTTGNSLSKLQFEWGGYFGVNIDVLNYVYASIGHFGYFSTLGIGGLGRLTYTFNPKNSLQLGVSLPIISWLSRSPYNINDDEYIQNTSSHKSLTTFFAFIGDGSLTSWGSLQSLSSNLAYQYQINSHWKLGISHQFKFLHAADPKHLLSYQNSLMIEGSYTF